MVTGDSEPMRRAGSGDGTERVEEGIESGSGSGGKGTVVAVDRLRIAPIRGVHTFQADFLVPETAMQAIIHAKANPDGKADVIMSDMMANATGNRTRDTQESLDICHAVCQAPADRKERRASGRWGLAAQTFRPPRVATINTISYISPQPKLSQRPIYYLCALSRTPQLLAHFLFSCYQTLYIVYSTLYLHVHKLFLIRVGIGIGICVD